MALNGSVHTSGQRVKLLDAVGITTAVSAVTTTPVKYLSGAAYLGAHAVFAYGSGGTTAKFWIQTSFDGTNWLDIMNFAFTTAILQKVGSVCAYLIAAAPATPTDGSLADNTVNEGLLGEWFRVKYTTTGTYAGGTTITINAIFKG